MGDQEEMDEDTWIRTYIRQRKCTVFSPLYLRDKSDNKEDKVKMVRAIREPFRSGEVASSDNGMDISNKNKLRCKCGLAAHATSRTDEDWSTFRNTRPEPCRNYGKISFGEEKTSKYVRIDVQTDMSVVEQLLLEVWRLPRPKWIFSFMEDPPEEGHEDTKEYELKCQLKGLMKSLSNGQHIWITTEGIQYGIAKLVGEYLKDNPSKYMTAIGVNGWGCLTHDARKALKTENPQLDEEETGNTPSVLYKHHLLVDDGSVNFTHANKSFQEFSMTLETTLTKYSEGTSSSPLVALLYCGWSYVLDGVQAAIDSNVPVVVLQGTGGFADVLASVFTQSKEDRTSASRGRNEEWTGTVIDDVLRDQVKEEFANVVGKEHEAGQYKILQCLQKRELITVVNIDEEETTLVNAVIQALLKSKSIPEVLKILDCYMPARLFDGEGAAAASCTIEEQRQHFSETTGMFLIQAMLMDQAEIVQFIIDYKGVDLAESFNEPGISNLWKETNAYHDQQTNDRQTNDQQTNDHTFDQQTLETTYNVFPLPLATSCGPKALEDVFRRLMIWAARTDRVKCATLFWKKGTVR